MKKPFFLFLLLGNCLSAQLYFPPSPGNSWDTTAKSSLNWCPAKVAALDSFLIASNSKSCIILKDGKIAHEAYYGTFTQDSLWYWASAGKTLTAFLIGKAQEQGLLNINDSTSKYLGAGWTSATPNKEGLITIKDQMQMTTGLDYNVPDLDCTADSCLLYRRDAGSQWYYHNAPYMLLKDVIESAAGIGINRYTQNTLAGSIGFRGIWLDNLYISNARQMARFGLLLLAKGKWNGQTVLADTAYLHAMTQSSQTLNPAYGYLTWLNGKNSFIQPGWPLPFNGPIISSAPSDLYMAAGKNDQRIYVVPSEGLVVVRQGNAADSVSLALSGFDDKLWQHINGLNCNGIDLIEESKEQVLIYPNPGGKTIRLDKQKRLLAVWAADGRAVSFSQNDGEIKLHTKGSALVLLQFEDGTSQSYMIE